MPANGSFIKLEKTYPKLRITVNGDDLYSKQPFIDELKKAKMFFILVAKPTDHKVLIEWVTELTQLDDGNSLELCDKICISLRIAVN